jgi:hypothetical protein
MILVLETSGSSPIGVAVPSALSSINARVIDNEIDLMGEAHGLNLFGRADCLLSLPDGRLLIIDHKKSGSGKRRDRMMVGWDLQLALYRAMLLKPEGRGCGIGGWRGWRSPQVLYATKTDIDNCHIFGLSRTIICPHSE